MLNLSPEVKDLHRTLSAAAAQFIEFVERHLREGRRFTFDKTGLPDWALEQSYPLQPWPILVGPEKLRSLREAAIAVDSLVKGIPERVFNLDADKVARFYGIQSYLAELMLTEPNGIPGALTRGDYFDGPQGLKCMELNGQAFLGGWGLRLFADKLAESPWMQEFLAQSGASISFCDPLERLFAHLLEELLASAFFQGGEINLAFLCPVDAGPSMKTMLSQRFKAFLDRTCPSMEGHVLIARGGELVFEGGALRLKGVRVDAVVEYFDGLTPPAVFRAFKSGVVNLYNGPASLFLADKRNLALLSEHQESEVYDAEERKAIQDHIPWTRLVRRGETSYRGEKVLLPEFLLARQEILVLKLGMSKQGEGVHVGWSCSKEEWRRHVDEALDSNNLWVVQERVFSSPYCCQSDHGPAPHDLVWGIFVFGRTYGGTFLRMMERGHDGIINSSRGATEGLMFEVA